MSEIHTNDKKGKDWKENLLKSSLPLEQLVSEKLYGIRQYCEELLQPNPKKINVDASDRMILNRRVDALFPMSFQTIVVQLDALENLLEMIEAAIKNS